MLKFKILFILLVLSSTAVASSILAQTCPNNLVNGDRDIWDYYSYMREQWYRNMFADFYNLEKGDWDEGWGWVKYNNPDPHLWEFCKMMSAGQLLWYGLDDALCLQGAWSARRSIIAATEIDRPNPELCVVSRNESSINFFYRDYSGKLRNMTYSGTPWHPGTFPPNSTIANVSNIVANEKEKYLLKSDPAVISRTESTIDVVAQNYNNELIHFSWDSDAGWSATNPTMLTVRTTPIGDIDRYFIYSKPIAIRRASHEFDVFALDNFNHLIHYGFYDGVNWFAEDVTQIVGNEYIIVSDPVAYRRSMNDIDIVGRTSYGNLIHFHWSNASEWSAVNITQDVGSTRRIEGNPSVVCPDGQTVFIFARCNYDMILYMWSYFTGWIELVLWGGDYAIQGDPVAISRSTNTLNVFASDINGRLIHFCLDPSSSSGSEDLTSNLGISVSDTITVFSSSENRIDVFSPWYGYLMHYHWTAELGWEAENATTGPNVSPNFDKICSKPIVVQRKENTLDVFGGKKLPYEYLYSTIHYTAAIGRTVNTWHTNAEYYNWAAGSKHDFEYIPEYSSEYYATASDDEVTMQCPIFDETPAFRAGAMLHEATHNIFWRFKHQNNLAGSSCTEPCSDNWFFHGVRHPSGNLNSENKNHSMIQLQIEYLTDISEFSRYDLPSSVYINAQGDAINLMNNRILNPPGWVPGVPRPLY